MLTWWGDLGDERVAETRALWLRRCWAAAMLGLIAVTWRVWLAHQEIFPQVPVLAVMAWLPGWVENVLAGGMIVGLLAALLWPEPLTPGPSPPRGEGRVWPRVACWLFALCWLVSAACDYQRLQPWAWQGALLALLFAAADAKSILAAARWITIGIYVHSALSKLDAEFLHTLGMQMAATLTGFVVLKFAGWSAEARFFTAALLPLGELLSGLLLAVPWRGAGWRWAGLGVAVAMHLGLLLVLGPLGLGHRAGVLLWNVFFIVQDLVLFCPMTVREGEAPAEPIDEEREGRSRGAEETFGTDKDLPISSFPSLLSQFASYLVLTLALGWPLLVFVELCDPWPAWGLYSPSASRVVLSIPPAARERVSADWQPFLEPNAEGSVLQVRLDRAALELLGTPLYPHARPQLGLADSLARRWRCEQVVRVELLGPSDRFLRTRRREPLLGRPAIEAAARRFRLNARAGDVLRE